MKSTLNIKSMKPFSGVMLSFLNKMWKVCVRVYVRPETATRKPPSWLKLMTSGTLLVLNSMPWRIAVIMTQKREGHESQCIVIVCNCLCLNVLIFKSSCQRIKYLHPPKLKEKANSLYFLVGNRKRQRSQLTKRQWTHHRSCLPLVWRSQLAGMNASVVVRRLAALSGASAVTAGAYGAHGMESHIHTAIAS